ncbi:hypothetical protein PFJ87_07g00580 [Encephalitozoon hellem]|uniref:Uncharacterized protein n=2 Tax=Encephalitozoon hellem TaxID=27973 RepID=A0ABY8CLG6_ENCHE|nr:hypothetical protein PFJ87_07g00580 [Encephalitozoon hellem]
MFQALRNESLVDPKHCKSRKNYLSCDFHDLKTMKFSTLKLATCYLYKVAVEAKASPKEEFPGDSDSGYKNEYLVTRTTAKDTFTPEMTRNMILENGLAIVRETTTFVNPHEVKFVPGSVLESLDKVAFASDRFGTPNKFLTKPDFSYMEGYNKMSKQKNDAKANEPSSASSVDNTKNAGKGEKTTTTSDDEKAGAEGKTEDGVEGQEQPQDNTTEDVGEAKTTDKSGFFPSGSFVRPSSGKYSSLA